MYYKYGQAEIDHLSKKDKKMAWAIAQIGHIDRPCEEGLFPSVVHHIIGQQISVAAQRTIWGRLCDKLGDVCPQALCDISDDDLQSIGISYKKVSYIKDFAKKVQSGEFDVDKLTSLSDDEVIRELSSLSGIGVWTAEMLMTFCMRRPDIVSFGDLAIIRGMRMLYRHRHIDKALFQKYKKRYSPYGTVASLYLWAIAGGAIEGLTDPAPKKKK